MFRTGPSTIVIEWGSDHSPSAPLVSLPFTRTGNTPPYAHSYRFCIVVPDGCGQHQVLWLPSPQSHLYSIASPSGSVAEEIKI